MRPTIKFTPNVPQEIGLEYPTGKIVKGFSGDQAMYSLSFPEGSVMFVDLALSQRIHLLQLQPGEHFFICKRPKNGSTPPRWDLWLSPATEQMRAQHEMAAQQPPDDEELQQQLNQSIMQARANRLPPQSAPQASYPPQTGTHGPVPVRRPEPPLQTPAWSAHLLNQTNALIDVYAAAVEHGQQMGVSGPVVRTLLLSAFIGLQKNPGGGHVR